MKQSLTPRAFLVRLLCVTLALLLLCGGILWLVDPYEHYRKAGTDYVINDRFCTPGMIAHREYDALLVGSSMCQNFDISDMEQKLGGEILKAVKGGMTLNEADLLCRLAAEAGQAEHIYLSIDLVQFNKAIADEEYYPEYLVNDTVLDDYRYLFGYEAWMRYVPLDTALILLEGLGADVPYILDKETEADNIGRWMERAAAQDAFVGEEKLIENYLAGKGTVSAQDTEGMYERMAARLDAWLATEPFDPDVEYSVFFAPYSVLYWAHAAREGGIEDLLAFREYYFARLSEFDNVRAFDFQAMDETRDLDLYKDLSHYHEDVNALMTRAMAEGTHLATAEAVRENNEKIRAGVLALCEKYPVLKEAL